MSLDKYIHLCSLHSSQDPLPLPEPPSPCRPPTPPVSITRAQFYLFCNVTLVGYTVGVLSFNSSFYHKVVFCCTDVPQFVYK